MDRVVHRVSGGALRCGVHGSMWRVLQHALRLMVWRSAQAVLRRFVPLSLCAMLLQGCASLLPAPAEPAWVLSPPSDTPADFYGVGEGPDIDSATRLALRQIAARLRVSISSTVDSSVSVIQQSVMRSGQTRVQEVVRDTEFTGVQLQQTARSSVGVYALVRVDRVAFARETRNRFETERQRVMQKLQGVDELGGLARYRALRAALPDIDRAIAHGDLLRVVDSTSVNATGLRQLEALRQRAQQAAGELLVRIEHDPKDADVAASLSETLTGEGFRLSADAGAAVLRMRVQSRTDQVFDAWNCRLDIQFQWLDERGETVANRSQMVNGVALDSAQRARQDAVRRLRAVLKAQGAPSALGLVL